MAHLCCCTATDKNLRQQIDNLGKPLKEFSKIRWALVQKRFIFGTTTTLKRFLFLETETGTRI
jgi:hypothetical protein